MNEQIIIQHALKYFAECEYEKEVVSVDTMSEKLSLSTDRVELVLQDLQAAGLVGPDELVLTGSGREYALHVLQAHRLYETYLARKTGLPESAWHKTADAVEHQLTVDDVQKLADELGHPRFDPHGDPIPTKLGEMPEKRGQLLTEFPAGWSGRVVHVEDEPINLYAHIAKAGIAPDTVLRIDEKKANEVVLFTEGQRYVFPNEVASQISVVDLTKGEAFDESVERLSSLYPGEAGDIVSLSPLCRGLERNRLLDLGVVPGTTVGVELINPSGSPIAYRIRGACIALRREQAERIRIRKVK